MEKDGKRNGMGWEGMEWKRTERDGINELGLDGWKDGWMHGCMDEWMDGWVEGQVDGWVVDGVQGMGSDWSARNGK